jgi:hypothetical protein
LGDVLDRVEVKVKQKKKTLNSFIDKLLSRREKKPTALRENFNTRLEDEIRYGEYSIHDKYNNAQPEGVSTRLGNKLVKKEYTNINNLLYFSKKVNKVLKLSNLPEKNLGEFLKQLKLGDTRLTLKKLIKIYDNTNTSNTELIPSNIQPELKEISKI